MNKPNFESLNESRTIEIGAIYEHDEGLKYQVDDTDIHDVTGYESGKEPKEFVLYTQLEAGVYPAGKRWVREKGDFLSHFKKSTGE